MSEQEQTPKTDLPTKERVCKGNSHVLDASCYLLACFTSSSLEKSLINF